MARTKEVADDTVEALKSGIYFAVRRVQAEMIQSDRSGELHVSDINKECHRNSVYSLRSPREGNLSTDSIETFWLGQMLHRTMDLKGILHEATMCYDLVGENVIPVKDGKVQWPDGFNKLHALIGSTDDVLQFNGVNVIVDKKTYTPNSYYPLKDAYEHHKDQINMYRFLLKKCKNVDIQYGANVYFNKRDGLSNPLVFVYKLEEIDVIHARLLSAHKIILEHMSKGTLPPRTKNWACDGYCPFAMRCFLEDD